MGFKTHAGVGLLMLAASALMLSPFISFRDFGSALHSGDGRVQAWVLAWVGHALGTSRPLFDANMFHPAPAALSHTDHMVVLGAIGAPIWWATRNAILEFNLLQVIGPALSAFAMFVLARAWTLDTGASIVAGLAYGFSTFTLLHNAHLNLTWSVGLPLTVLGLERWWSEPTWPRLARWWIPAMFTALVSWYLALLLAVLMVACTLWLLLTRDREGLLTKVVQVGASGALALAILLPLVSPYLGRGSEAGEAAALAADWRSYLVPSEHTFVGRWLVSQSLASPQTIWGERTLFLGWTSVALAVIGSSTATIGQRPRVLLLLAIAALAVSLSFGPSSGGYAPFDVLARLPGIGGFRATARFALLVTFAVALLTGMGVAWVRRRHRLGFALVPAICGCLVLAEVFVVDFPAGKPVAEVMPEIYRLAAEDGARAGVALPMYAGQTVWFLEGDYLLYSTTAEFVPLANGIGRWVPDEYLALGEVTRSFPSPATAAALRLYGITHVLFHGQRFGSDAAVLLDRAREGSDFSIIATRGSDTLLRVNPK
ncbi:MAG: hypothetical protein ACRD1H_01640 [Vicinamibacterales bacterium]